MHKILLFMGVAFIISCSKGNNTEPGPIFPLNKENIDTLSCDESFVDSAFYGMINKRDKVEKVEVKKAKMKKDILIELHFPEDIYFSPNNKYILNILNFNASGDHFMYMGKVQKHIYLKNYPCVGNIECPDIEIMDLNDSISYYWCPSKDDNPFRFHGNKIIVHLSSNSIHPNYLQGVMSQEEQTIMNMQPNFIDEIQSKTSILYKEYMDSIHQQFHP